jgi:hypothetical protein
MRIFIAHHQLCATRDLLAPGLHSVISAEVLSTSLATASVNQQMQEVLRCDLTTFAALTGLVLSDACRSATANYRNVSNDEIQSMMGKMEGKQGRRNSTLRWHFMSPGATRVSFIGSALADTLMSIYKRMFASSFDMSFDNMNIKHLMTQIQGQNVFASPTIQTFARLVRIALDTVHDAEEAATVRSLLNEIQWSGFSIQGQHVQQVRYISLLMLSCSKYMFLLTLVLALTLYISILAVVTVVGLVPPPRPHFVRRTRRLNQHDFRGLVDQEPLQQTDRYRRRAGHSTSACDAGCSASGDGTASLCFESFRTIHDGRRYKWCSEPL